MRPGIEREPLEVNGVLIGELELTSSRREGNELVIGARFHPNWPGLWHAAARSLDGDPK